MGFVSKMSVLKVLEVVGEVSGFSGTVGFWSQMALCTFRNFLEVDHSQSPQLIVTTSRSSRSSLHRHRDRVSRRVSVVIMTCAFPNLLFGPHPWARRAHTWFGIPCPQCNRASTCHYSSSKRPSTSGNKRPDGHCLRRGTPGCTSIRSLGWTIR